MVGFLDQAQHITEKVGIPKNAPHQLRRRHARRRDRHPAGQAPPLELRRRRRDPQLRRRRHDQHRPDRRHRRRARDLRGPVARRARRLPPRPPTRHCSSSPTARPTRPTRTTYAWRCAPDAPPRVSAYWPTSTSSVARTSSSSTATRSSSTPPARCSAGRPVRRRSCWSSTSTSPRHAGDAGRRRALRRPRDQTYDRHLRAVRGVRAARRPSPMSACRVSRRSGRRSSSGSATTSTRTVSGRVLFGMSGGIDSTLVGAIAVDALGAGERLRRLQPERVVERALQVRRRRAGPAHRAARSTPSRSRRSSTRTRRRCTSTGSPRRTCRPASARSSGWGCPTSTATSCWRAATSQSWRPATPRSTAMPSARTPRSRTCPRRSCGSSPGGATGRRGARRDTAHPRGHHHQAAVGRAAARTVRLDSLPPYDLLDAVLDAYVERDLGSADVIAEGFDPALVERVITLVDRAEYKRRQYPPGPKVSRRNFGRDRRRADHPPLAREARRLITPRRARTLR